jgi:deoxyribodipyrimidine photolyase-related protein
MDILILPHQLYAKKYLQKKSKIILWEHPQYFTKYKYNKKRLMLHRASMKYYHDYLKQTDYKVTYINFNQEFKPANEYMVFDPIDIIKLPGKYTIIESPNFLLSSEQYDNYNQKSNSFKFKPFYNYVKSELDMLVGVKNQDSENRQKMPPNTDVPEIPQVKNKYIDQSAGYVEKHFGNNYGNTDDFNFPVTHNEAKKWLRDFADYRLYNFGAYEDYVDDSEETLFHSRLSSSLNNGLLQPQDVIAIVQEMDVPLNSYEGFFRQLVWREYQRYCYIYIDISKEDFFKNTNKLTKKWYDGTTGLLPLDNCIIKAFQTGYLHHIERLMIVGSYMNMSGIKPEDGRRWFMEFSCDSYEWVMEQNVLDMVFFCTAGKTTRKPYISSSNYLLKMSNYTKDDWCKEWDNAYNSFLKKHRQKLQPFRYYFPTLNKK